MPFIGSGIHACRLHWKQVIQHVHRILHWGRITAWPHHWMFTAVTVLVPPACAVAVYGATFHFRYVQYVWLMIFSQTFHPARVQLYITYSKIKGCNLWWSWLVGWLVGWRPTNLCVPNIYLKCIIPLIYNPTIQLCRWNLQSNLHYIEIHIVCLGHIIPSWVGVLGTSPKLI